MNYIIDLENIKHKCRVCLSPSNRMIALTSKLDEEDSESPDIFNALEKIFSIQVETDFNYPEVVCFSCYNKIKISYGLKTTFQKSQYVLEKYFSYINKTLTKPKTEEDSEDEIEKNELEEDFEYVEEEEVAERELPLSDYVILQVTDDNEEEQFIKNEPEDIEDTIKEDLEPVDDEVTTEFQELESEFEINKPEPRVLYNCPFCDKNLFTKRDHEKHTKICQRYKLIKCEFCNQQFSSLMRKHYHLKMKHSDAPSREVKCSICNEVFEHIKARSYHLKTKHALKKFSCEICGKMFHFKNGLETHMDTHNKDKFREICPVCGKGFYYRGGLFYHMKIHRGERNYICSYCSARFLNISGLKKHTRIHTGEKPCQCEYCGKSFRSSSTLKKHVKTHTGHRPHSCSYCGKGFISAYNLKVHMAGHIGDHPCAYCDRSFLNEEVLMLHVKFKHNVKEGAQSKDESE